MILWMSAIEQFLLQDPICNINGKEAKKQLNKLSEGFILGILFTSKIFAFEEVLVKVSVVYSLDGSMGSITLKLYAFITCFKYIFQNNKNGSKHVIRFIILGFPFTIGIHRYKEMLVKISGFCHFEGSTGDLCLKTYCLILHLQSHSQSSIST